jgi:hypothetical protein
MIVVGWPFITRRLFGAHKRVELHAQSDVEPL